VISDVSIFRNSYPKLQKSCSRKGGSFLKCFVVNYSAASGAITFAAAKAESSSTNFRD